jgi:hypothetical protein
MRDVPGLEGCFYVTKHQARWVSSLSSEMDRTAATADADDVTQSLAGYQGKVPVIQ